MTKPLRVLLISRLFTGLADSFLDQNWKPRGVPAIYKLINKLMEEPEIDSMLVFSCKDEGLAEKFMRNRTIVLRGLGKVRVLGWRQRPWFKFLGVSGQLREVSHFVYCLIFYFRFRPDVTYFTNANIVAAGLFSRLGLGPVVLRLLGLHPVEKEIATRSGGIMGWFYRSPFTHVVCTRDGSGASYYLPQLLRSGVPVSLELNGVERVLPNEHEVAKFRSQIGLGGRPVVMFIGRLEESKGCDMFVEGMVLLLQGLSVDAVIVGDGAMKTDLQRRISEAGLTDAIHLIGSVTHDQIPAVLAVANIYVSLNQFGNLSNINLEAISQGKCMVILDSDPQHHIDDETVDLLSKNIFPRISRIGTAEDLARRVGKLLNEPDRIELIEKRTREVGTRMLSSWTDRLNLELKIIRDSSES